MSAHFRILTAIALLVAWQVAAFWFVPVEDSKQLDFNRHNHVELSAATSSSLRAIESSPLEKEGASPRRAFARWFALLLSQSSTRQSYEVIQNENSLLGWSSSPLWLIYGAFLC